MPLINVKLIEDVFTPDQKRQIVGRLTDAMVSIEGENMHDRVAASRVRASRVAGCG